MATFKDMIVDVVGPEVGQMMEQYWLYPISALSIFIILYQIGMWKIIYKVIKQAVVMTVMLLCATICYVLMAKHVTTLTSIGTTAVLSAINDAVSGNPSQLLSNSKIMDPITEILVISGATLFLLGVLYRQLPVTLIPNCIPCIGGYDTMMAGFYAFCGFNICVIGMYCQLNYSNAPNSTTSIVEVVKNGTNYVYSVEEFMQNDDAKKWDNVMVSAEYVYQRATEITSQSFEFIYNQISKQIKLHNTANVPRNEL
eukprot:10570_1